MLQLTHVDRGVVNGGMVNRGMVDGCVMDGGMDGAVTMAASTRVGVDEGHKGQDCHGALKHATHKGLIFKLGTDLELMLLLLLR